MRKYKVDFTDKYGSRQTVYVKADRFLTEHLDMLVAHYVEVQTNHIVQVIHSVEEVK